MQERESLIARIRHLRRARAAPQESDSDSTSAALSGRTDAARADALEGRLAHLEQLVEGLQDAVHRESERQDKLIAELQAQIQPAAMGVALNKDARERGL